MRTLAFFFVCLFVSTLAVKKSFSQTPAILNFAGGIDSGGFVTQAERNKTLETKVSEENAQKLEVPSKETAGPDIWNQKLSEEKVSAYKQVVQQAKSRCFKSPETEPPLLYKKNRSWYVDLPLLNQIFMDEYKDSNRLHNRVYYDEQKQKFLLPYGDSLEYYIKFIPPKELKFIELTDNFIANVTSHIEIALENSLADYIHFSDMGHSHLLIPEDFYDKEIRSLGTDDESMRTTYQKLLNYEGSRFIYHTAEQLRMISKKEKGSDQEGFNYVSPYMKRRYLTRNIVGGNNFNNQLEIVQIENASKEYNTVRKYQSYYWWSAGYYIHSNEKGCFSYQKEGRTYYFDISLEGALYIPEDK